MNGSVKLFFVVIFFFSRNKTRSLNMFRFDVVLSVCFIVMIQNAAALDFRE